MKRYNQKLATICEWLQTYDQDGSYIELLEEYQNEEISYSEAIRELKSITKRLYEKYQTKEYKKILDYINY